MKEYNKANIPLAKSLRKNMTPWERKLRYEFLRYYPIRFQRQKAIGNYIADFYCAKARLLVELDGGGHYTVEQIEKDEVRMLESKGQCFGLAISIPMKNTGVRSYKQFVSAYKVLSKKYNFKVYDMYYGNEVDKEHIKILKQEIT